MKISSPAKIVLTYFISFVLAYFLASWLGGYLDDGSFWVMSGGLIAFSLLPFIFIFFVVLFANLWFQKLNKWSYLIPAILILLFVGLLGYSSNNLLFVLKYWLIAFVGGWVLARVVNFVAGMVGRKNV